MMRSFSLILLSLILLGSFTVEACYVPMANQVVQPEFLVGRTQNIVLAKAVSSKSLINESDKKSKFLIYPEEYTFKISESLKGTAVGDIILSGRKFKDGDNEDFKGHTDPKFWESYGGRAAFGVSCHISKGFEVGKTYLLFLDKPYHIKSFELIEASDDKWLVEVKKLIALGKSK